MNNWFVNLKTYESVQRTSSALNLAVSLPLRRMQPRKWHADTSMRMFVTYDLLTGHFPSIDELNCSLQHLDPHELLFFGSKIGLTLDRDNGTMSRQYQLKIATDLLPVFFVQRYLGMQTYFDTRDSERLVFEGTRPLITPTVVLNFLKKVLVHHEFAERLEDNAPFDEREAFRLVLGFGARSVQKSGAVSFSTKDLLCEFTKNTLLLNRENVDRLLGRYYQLLIGIPEKLGPSPHFNSTIASAFEKATGLGLNKLFALGIGILTSYANATLLFADGKSDSNSRHFYINFDEYFREIQLDKLELENLRAFFSMSVREARSIFKGRTDSSLAFMYDVLPFMEKPIIDLNNSTSIVSHFPFLYEKFTSGLL